MRLDYPATGRNKDAILQILQEWLPENGTVLEIASGSGQHTAHFAPYFPNLHWQPTDIDESVLASIDDWNKDFENVLPGQKCDITQDPISNYSPQAIFCANMIHIAPKRAATDLIQKASEVLPKNGRLILYGPFLFSDRPNAQSNLEFSESLKQRDPEWGVRAYDEIQAKARSVGFQSEALVPMPANNFSIIWSLS